MNLVEELIQQGWLKTPRIIDAFNKIERADFLPEKMQKLAGLNEALPIGFNQTISQPLVVAFMLELLDPMPGENILDIGSGSGWTTALLAHIVSSVKSPDLKPKITALELVPELKEFGEKNVAKYNFIEKNIAEFICTDGSKGYRPKAPYDKILVSAAAPSLPKELKSQLKKGGKIVIPINNSIWLFSKSFSEKQDEIFEQTEYPGFIFVPLIEKND